MINPYISSREASSRLQISEQMVRKLLRDGRLEGDMMGKIWLINSLSVENYRRQIESAYPSDQTRQIRSGNGLKTMSFFSGAMGLDLGLEQEGIHVSLVCEIDKHTRSTILANRPEVALLGDLAVYSTQHVLEAADLKRSEVDLIVGGPPCQAFSTAGARRGFNDHRGNIFLRFIDLILDIQPKYAVIENVRGLLSAPLHHRPHSERGHNHQPLSVDEMPGGALMHVVNRFEQAGYGVSFNLYNSANYGVPQIRERVIMICHRGGEKLPYLTPTHSEGGGFGLKPWVSLREAIADLPNDDAIHATFPEERLRYYRLLKAGQYWKHLPTELQKQALGNSYYAGGGKTGFLRRLAWDRPSCTLVTSPAMPATDICHPDLDRPLSVQEYKRIQQFPDDWIVSGSVNDQYRQIGNAVPVGLGRAIGRAILQHVAGKSLLPPVDFPFSRYKGNDDRTWKTKNFDNLLGKNRDQSDLFTGMTDAA
jgi:DNA (cytosine-5)-methyltransferase 1